MADIHFTDAQQQPLELPDTDAVQQSIAAAQNWADDNSLELSFALESDGRLYIHLGGIRLNNWLDMKFVNEGDVDSILEALDYARFEYRRSASGYGKFDR
ncbi:MAG: hypothetical protein HC933_08205 [Pleurocapsa sp. SU_196_0]|nr:hypothetical protein [Pleurocapsa sp. SU_196_0]